MRKRQNRTKSKSKAESMTGKKAAKVEVRTGELELKPVEIDSKDVQVHMRAIKSAQEKKDTAVALLRNAKRAAKQVHEELPGAIEKVIRTERGMGDLRAELEVLNIVLREQGAAIQLTIHDTLLGDAKDAAYQRGVKDAKAEKFSSDPYPAGSDLSDSYKAGWESVMASRVAGDDAPLPSNGAEELREGTAAH